MAKRTRKKAPNKATNAKRSSKSALEPEVIESSEIDSDDFKEGLKKNSIDLRNGLAIYATYVIQL